MSPLLVAFYCYYYIFPLSRPACMQAGTPWAVFSLVCSTHPADTVKRLPVNIKLANTQMHYHTHCMYTHMHEHTHRDTAAKYFTMSACHFDFGC